MGDGDGDGDGDDDGSQLCGSIADMLIAQDKAKKEAFGTEGVCLSVCMSFSVCVSVAVFPQNTSLCP